MDNDDTNIDLYSKGYDAHKKGLPRPNDYPGNQGWDDRERDLKVVVIMPKRPEGYYHSPLEKE